MLARCVSVLIRLTNHRVCCRIPEWTVHVGRPWEAYDVQPWNLYNVWWRSGQWLVRFER